MQNRTLFCIFMQCRMRVSCRKSVAAQRFFGSENFRKLAFWMKEKHVYDTLSMGLCC